MDIKDIPTGNDIRYAYLGNSQVKRDGVSHNFTPEQVQEYVKCAKNASYFAETYMKVIHVDRGLVPFKLYDYQRKMIDHFENNRFSIVLACRQSGKSISSVAYILWKALFNPEQNIAILANKGATAGEMLGRLTLALENVPFFLQPGCKVLNKRSITFSNNSRVFSASTSSSSIRGQAVTLLYLDEFAFVQRAEEFYTATYPVITSGETTQVIITSTANGIGNIFYKKWEGALQKTNEFAPFRVDWWDVPGRDEKWKAQTIANTSELQFDQEFGNSFIGTASTLIEANTLLGMQSQVPLKTLYNNNLRIFENPHIADQNIEDDKDHYYIMTVDVSQGRGQDCSAFSIIDITQKPFKLVASFNDNKISPLLLPDLLVKMALQYNGALIIIENNGPGQIVCNSVYYDYEYENLFVESVVKAGGLGVTTTRKVKRIGCSNMKDLIESNSLIINDPNTIVELSYFEESGSSYAASKDSTDDLVMTIVIFSWFVSSAAFGNYNESDIRKMVFENNMLAIDNELMDFGFISEDHTSGTGLGEEFTQLMKEAEEWKI